MKLKYTIIFLIMILSLNGVFANCIINSGYLSNTNCNSVTKKCTAEINSQITILEDSPGYLFTGTNCSDYNIDITINGITIIQEKKDFALSGLDSDNSNINTDITINGPTKIYLKDKTDWESNTRNLKFNNVTINSDSYLNIEEIRETTGSIITFELSGETIFVKQNGTLNIIIDGKEGYQPSSDGGDGYRGDNISINVDSLNNYGKTKIQLTSGKGGHGDDRQENDPTGGGDDQGGHGGNGGDILFEISKIYNADDLIIELNSGMGGDGGMSSIDDSGAETMEAGHGARGGNITISNITNIINEQNGTFNLSAIAGKGGNGGNKRGGSKHEYCDKGDNGDGGNGGSVYDLNIRAIQNESLNFTIYLQNGALGRINTIGNCINRHEEPYGKPGYLGDINIYYLKNTKNAINLISKYSFTDEEYKMAKGELSVPFGRMYNLDDLNLKLSDITINHLLNGSYLPKNIESTIGIDDYRFENQIDISGCYIYPAQTTIKANNIIKIAGTNTQNIKPNIISENAAIITQYKFCPHCEVISLDDDQSRYTKQYNLYSNIDGNINPGDLNIYYSDYNSGQNTIYYTKRTDGKELPVYTNKNPISGVSNTKINSYEYLITPEDLNWYSYDPEEDRDNLNSEAGDYLFCYGEEYILDGKITTTQGNKSFNFPFVPLREQFNN